MNIVVIILTVLMHLVLTGLAFLILKTTIKSDPAKLTKRIFAVMGLRFILPLAFYAVCLFVWKDSGSFDKSDLKMFTVFYLILYLLFLVIDTAYFYFTLKNLDKNNKEEK